MRLFCEDGKHFWDKKGRGRPPKSCPQHRPKPNISSYTTLQLTPKDGDHRNLETSNYELTRTLYCQGGKHEYQAPVKRGRAPLSCKEHSVIGAVERKGELDQEKKEKAQKLLQDEIARLSARVEDAEIVDRDAMTKLQAAGGVNKADEEFKIWLRANTALLHEVESLRARERKLAECQK